MLEPHANTSLIGHANAERALLDAWRSGRLPHAWLITGPPGIGKATLAYRFVRFLLATPDAGEDALFAPPPPTSLAVSADHPVARRIAARGHRDVTVLERELDEKKGQRRAAIVVDQVRDIGAFVHLTAADGGWRAVIVDSVDDMNSNAANSLLKILEEPPEKTTLLLISHAPGKLLPTIRSRCRRLPLSALSDTEVATVLRDAEAEPEALRLAIGMAEGSPGRALELIEGGALDLYRQMIGLIERPDELAVHGFGDRLARPTGVEGFQRLADLYPWWLTRVVRAGAGGEAMPQILGGEAELAAELVRRVGLDHLIEVWEKATRLFAQAIGLNLDRKQVILEAFALLHARS